MKLIPEWYEHQYCLIAWPCNKDLYGKIINKARDEVANVINEIAKTEHVIVLSNKEEARKINDMIYDNKVMDYLNSILKINEKELVHEDFIKKASEVMK